MRIAMFALAVVAAAVLAGCSRHVVVERNVGRVDRATSITSNSDLQWTVVQEPAPEQAGASSLDEGR